MRMMLRAELDTRAANEAFRNGRMQTVIESVVERLRPEAVYFSPHHGGRSCTMVFDMEDSSQLPAIAEPMFSEFDAKLEIQPAMNLEDLQRGLAAA